MKDLGFLSRRRYFENYIGLYGDAASAERLINVIRSGRAKYAVFTEGVGEDQLWVNPKVRKWVLENCNLIAEFGNYRIYQYESKSAREAGSLLNEH